MSPLPDATTDAIARISDLLSQLLSQNKAILAQAQQNNRALADLCAKENVCSAASSVDGPSTTMILLVVGAVVVMVMGMGK
ncbi:hypothetical protein XANCAGTX0491_002778 [Xanthoria calcicola]